MSEAEMAAMAQAFPHLSAMLAEVAHDDDPDSTIGWCDDQTEFEFGLDVLLDGLGRRLALSPDLGEVRRPPPALPAHQVERPDCRLFATRGDEAAAAGRLAQLFG